MWTYRVSGIAYTVVVIAMLWPMWIHGAILAPTCHAQINGWQYVTAEMRACEQRKLADYEEEFLPEISNQLTVPRSGFIVTRNEYTELGRPTKHLTGNTPANLFTWVIYQIAHDPYTILTYLAISQWWLLGFFVLCACRLWGIDARAGWLAAVSAVATPFVVYWLSFPMHVATLCWGAGVIYACTRVWQRPDVLGWLVAAFSGYSMILMGYPQTAVYSCWMVAGYVIIQSIPLWQARDWRALTHRVGLIASAALVGAALTTPVLWDVYQRYRDSQRFWMNDDFFVQSVQIIDQLTVAWRYGVSRLVPEVMGTPIDPAYVYEFDGASWPLLSVALVVLAARYRWHASWYWLLVSALLALLTVVPALFLWLIHTIPGFRLSAWTPLWSAVLPVAYAVGWGADALMRVQTSAIQRTMRWIAVVMLGCVGLGVGMAWYDQIVPVWWHVAGLCAIVVVWWWWSRRLRDGVVVVGVLLSVGVTAWPLMRLQLPETLIRTTTLTQLLQREVPQGARYAIVSDRLGHLLSPNYNAMIGVASVHAYNNFYPRAYTTLIDQLGGDITVYGKLNKFIAPDPQRTVFWMSNIAVLITDQPFDAQNVTVLATDHDLMLYRVQARMGTAWRIAAVALPGVSDIRIPDYRGYRALPWQLTRDDGDRVEYTVAPHDTPTVLVKSTLYEPFWRAEIRQPDGVWVATRTVSVNGIFLAAQIPAKATGVRFVYDSAVQWMWVSHVIWGGLGLLMVGKTSMDRMRRRNIDEQDAQKEHR